MVQGRTRLSWGPAVESTRAIAALLVNRSLEIHQSLSMMGHIFYSNDVIISAVRLLFFQHWSNNSFLSNHTSVIIFSLATPAADNWVSSRLLPRSVFGNQLAVEYWWLFLAWAGIGMWGMPVLRHTRKCIDEMSFASCAICDRLLWFSW